MMIGKAFLIALMAAALAACGANADEELNLWISAQKNKSRSKISAIAAPKKFQPESYSHLLAPDPFSVQKLTQILNMGAAAAQLKGSLIAPELKRNKEGLEAYPTDVIAMVGTIIKNGKPVALVKVEKLLYQVQQGSHLGQNYGLVTAINEREITLREIVQDGLGVWTERKATLRLQEGLK